MREPYPDLLASKADQLDDAFAQIICQAYQAYQESKIDARRWRIEQSPDPLKQWLQFHAEATTLPGQGWKLHVSSNASSAFTVLRHVLPILFAGSIAFKIAASVQRLKFLNRGGAGRSQIGKFITIYPACDEQAVELALLLDEATSNLEGPSIPSDHPLRPGSLVYYRYGGFSSQLFIQNNLGLIVPGITTPEHEIEPDERYVPYQSPAWVIDPFLRAGVATELPALQRLLGNRYVIVAIIASSMNSTIYLGSDLEAARTCIIKGPGFAHYNTFESATHLRVEHEAAILRCLAPDRHFPALFDVIEQERRSYLVLEDIEGGTLDIFIAKQGARGKQLSQQQVIAWSLELAEIAGMIHAQNLVYTDFKTSNIILGTDGRLHLIDFELTHDTRDTAAKWRGCGTKGYMSPQQVEAPASILDDIYGFGALLYALLSGAEPSYAPDPLALLKRPIECLNPLVSPTLQAITLRCLQHDPLARYHSMSELRGALEQAGSTLDDVAVPFGSEWQIAAQDTAQQRYRRIAMDLRQTLCAQAFRPGNAEGLAWRSAHQISYGLLSRDINTGNSGTLLALAELVCEAGDAHAQAVLEAGAHWLSCEPAKNHRPLPGLYVGEAGVGAALLRAGQVLRNTALLEQAAAQGRLVAALPYGSPDLSNGTAGRLRFHLLLWDETGEAEHLQAACLCGEQLLTAACILPNGDVSWTIPDGYDSLSGHAYLGYAHGAAGIADALLDLFEVTADERLATAVRGAGSLLMRLALPALDDESGCTWPRVANWLAAPAFWCHGATGIGRFFLHAARAGVVYTAMDYAVRAARMVARGNRGAGPTQCHGLAGNIEFLLDMYQATSDRAYMSEALSLASLLEAFASERDGQLVFSSELSDVFTPDYMVGYAGIAMAFLRLSQADYLPHQLTRPGFRQPTRPVPA